MTLSPKLTIIPIPAFKDNYIWCIVPPNSKQCVIVDPGEAAPVIAFLAKQQLQLQAIWVTHHHWDHTNGIAELVEKSNVPVYGSGREPLKQCDYPLKENDVIYLNADTSFRIIEIPGHTHGHLAYYGNDVVFTGDTLFTGGCGRIFEGTSEQMFASLQKLMALPDDTLIYCGHEYTESNLRFAKAVEPNNRDLENRIAATMQLRQVNQPTVPSTLLLEKQTNPFLRTNNATIKKAAENFTTKILNDPVAVFTSLRHWKNNF